MTIRIRRAIFSVRGLQTALKYWIHENSLGIESLVGFTTITMLKLGHQRIIHKRHEQQRHMTGRPAHPCSRPSHDQMINLHQVNDQVWKRAPHPIRQFCANSGEEFFFKSQIENYSSSIHVSLQRSSFFQQQSSSDNRYLNHSRGDNLLQIVRMFSFSLSKYNSPNASKCTLLCLTLLCHLAPSLSVNKITIIKQTKYNPYLLGSTAQWKVTTKRWFQATFGASYN